MPHFRPMARMVGLFIYDRFQLLDVSGPIAAFEIAERVLPGSYQVAVLSIDGGVVHSSSGVAVHSSATDKCKLPDTLLVVGGFGTQAASRCSRSINFLVACATDMRRVCGVCTGSFLLGAAGMLDGRRATTHWRYAVELQRTYPTARVEPDKIYVRDANIWTSGGICAGIDLALALIAEDCGDKIARRVAREMVVYYRRPGGQSQFSILAELGGGDSVFSALLAWIRTHLSDDLSVEQLASQVAMSPRNFSRAFKQSVGVTPAKAVEQLRLEAARERIEHSRTLVSEIAASTGFKDIERMRRAFVRTFGRTPQDIRRADPGG